MIELERRFLAKRIPDGLASCSKKEMVDIYLPSTAHHPTLRLRKQGDKLEMTKKEPVKEGDSSKQLETTIPLRVDEYSELEKNLPGKRIQKTRYYYPFEGRTAEVDVFRGDLEGLVVVEMEFELENEKDEYQMPDFCLVDVSQATFLAGGMLCGKKYADIENELKRFDYRQLTMGE